MRRNRDSREDERNKNFEEVKKLMPLLLEEMRNGFTSKKGALIREFVLLPNKNVTFNSGSKKRFEYYSDEHEDLHNKVDILDNYGFVIDVTQDGSPIYRITEEFFELIQGYQPDDENLAKKNSKEILTDQGRVPDRHTAKHRRLKERVEQFLVSKGYNPNDFIEGVENWPDIVVENDENGNVLIVELRTSDTPDDFKKAKRILDGFQHADKTTPAFIAVWSDNDYGFEIYSASGIAEPIRISHDVFPRYNNSKKDDGKSDASGGESGGNNPTSGTPGNVTSKAPDDMNEIRKEFIGFLTGIKKWPFNYIQDFVVAGYIGKTGVVDLSIIKPDSGKIIAIIEFMSNAKPDILQKANSLVRFHRDSLNQPGILGYIVTPREKNVRHSFDIYEVSENVYPEFVTVEKFLSYLGPEGVTLGFDKKEEEIEHGSLQRIIGVLKSWQKSKKTHKDLDIVKQSLPPIEKTYDILCRSEGERGAKTKDVINWLGTAVKEGTGFYPAMLDALANPEVIADFEKWQEKQSVETPNEPDEFKIIELRRIFEKYLQENKGYIPNNFETYDDGEEQAVTRIIDIQNNETLVVIMFGLNDDISTAKRAWDHFIKMEYVDIAGYLVLPGESSLGEEFNILKFSEHANKYSHISIDAFPAYDELDPKTPDKKVNLFKFRGGVDIEGSQICDKIIDLVGDSNIGLYAEDVDESYANLRLSGLKRTDNVAVQIHKYGEYENQIALAVVGPMKGVKVSEPKLNDFIDKGKITGLSGYKRNIPGEKAWLNGNLPKKGTREKTTVYIIQGEIVTVPEQLNALGEILNLGVENIEKYSQKEPEKPKAESEFVSIGSGCHIRRNALPEERCLNVHSYANVLSTFFKKANGCGEFCFGLFGHWGRGKTFLMDMVKEELSKEKKNNYETIHFSAWKYRTTPEAWIHLYETFADHLTKSKNCFSILPYLIRAGLSRLGILPILFCVFIFGISLFPLIKLATGLSFFIISGVGLSAFFLFIRLFFGFRRAKSIFNQYVTLKRHGEKLGLQALIGKDLKSLIIGWIPSDFFKDKTFAWGVPYLISVLIIGLIVFPIKPENWPNWLVISNIPIWLSWTVFIIWLILSVSAMFFTFKWGRNTKQLLLVVDDLDRCRPEQMLEIMESLKLMLEDDEIHERVQVVMLVDEEMLRHAIHKKFEVFIKRNHTDCDADNSKANMEEALDRIVNEHIEKLFACYLRLPELSFDEVSEVTRKYLELHGSIEGAVGESSTLAATGSEDGVPENDNKKPLELDKQERPSHDKEITKKEPIAPKTKREVSVKDTVFEPYERGRLAFAIPAISQFDKSRKWGPRSIRALLFKYQLSRLLLMALGIEFTPKELIDGLNAAAANSPDRSNGQFGKSKDVRRVIDQVK